MATTGILSQRANRKTGKITCLLLPIGKKEHLALGVEAAYPARVSIKSWSCALKMQPLKAYFFQSGGQKQFSYFSTCLCAE